MFPTNQSQNPFEIGKLKVCINMYKISLGSQHILVHT